MFAKVIQTLNQKSYTDAVWKKVIEVSEAKFVLRTLWTFCKVKPWHKVPQVNSQ